MEGIQAHTIAAVAADEMVVLLSDALQPHVVWLVSLVVVFVVVVVALVVAVVWPVVLPTS